MRGLVSINGSFLFGTLPRDRMGSRRVQSKRLTITIILASAVLLMAAACSSDGPEGTRVSAPEFDPRVTPKATIPPDEPTTPPEPTQTPDAVNGEKVFLNNGCSRELLQKKSQL